MVFRIIKRAPWIALGAAIAWFADPVSGSARRREARQRLEELSDSTRAEIDLTDHEVASSPIARAS